MCQLDERARQMHDKYQTKKEILNYVRSPLYGCTSVHKLVFCQSKRENKIRKKKEEGDQLKK